MNRFNILGSAHTIVSYGAALNAIRLGDSSSDASIAIFGWAALCVIVTYSLLELALHARHRTLAVTFQEVYKVGDAALQYEADDRANPGKKVRERP